MKKRVFIMIICVLAFFCVSIVFSLRYFIPNYKNIDFEMVYSETGKFDESQCDYWFSLRHPSYQGFFAVEKLDGLGIDHNNIDFDFEKYTYVITIGRELLNISYSYTEMKNRKLIIIPRDFVGIVELSKEYTDKIYIYRINKMNIDCDYHERNRNVTFK